MSSILPAYKNLTAYFGDIHNHCAVGYGHGTIEEAFQNARLQLDFAAVSVHAYWPDIPTDEVRLTPVVDYHQRGFKKTEEAWPHVQAVVEQNNQPGQFVTFLGFEWHSREYGDHNVYYRDGVGKIIRAADLAEMRQTLASLQDEGIEALVIPHHIGYKQGYRGVNWNSFTSQFSPIVEIMSMHGASESSDAPYPYLHTMGPRDWSSTYQYGLAQGYIVGVMGSTDHHSGHPGSYGHGRMAVWAEALNREAVWQAIKDRRTWALTGDNISLAFSINEGLMGDVLNPDNKRHIAVSVVGGHAIDYVDVVYNNRIIHRANSFQKSKPATADPFDEPFKIHLELGWAAKKENVDWQVELDLINGAILHIEPRFGGHELVAPQADEEESYAFSHWQQSDETHLEFSTRTWGNPTSTTANTQGVCLEVSGRPDTLIRGQINGKAVEFPLTALIEGPRAGYLGGFLTPAYYFHRAIPQTEYTCDFEFVHQSQSLARDWYYLRVRQTNGQWAWSSPIWIEAA